MSRSRCVAVLVTFFALMAAPAVSEAQSTFLINGSFDQSPDWAQPGSDEFNAIAATYGTSPMPWQWTRNSWTEILPPNYSGIVYGGLDLANFLNSLPPWRRELDFYCWFTQSVFDAWEADQWLDSTKIEVEGPSFMFSGLGHSDLHESGVWNTIAPFCS